MSVDVATEDSDFKISDLADIFDPQELPRTSHPSRIYGFHGARCIGRGLLEADAYRTQYK